VVLVTGLMILTTVLQTKYHSPGSEILTAMLEKIAAHLKTFQSEPASGFAKAHCILAP
jgi:hypothetical protein